MMPTNNHYGFIYKTVLPDGRYYIGQHKIISYNTLDPYYVGSGRIMKDYINSKGRQGLTRTILEFANDAVELNLLESKYVTSVELSDPMCLNLDHGGAQKFTRYQSVKLKIGATIKRLRQEHPEKWTSRTGQDNNKSCSWLAISPQGQEYRFVGGLAGFCKSHNLSVNTIKKAVSEGWIPQRGPCRGWKFCNLTTGKATHRETQNRGWYRQGVNNPSYKRKIKNAS